ncbi:zinc-binding metallopeptidase family protein [Candidatus Symbiobacter mobilis]|uniref:Zinc-ribbon domain-containing protein n=1 Tax=Candidatus Symbiobacter mobilis CR TaxID=946483 RepID=U5NCX9_9BURK|nr:putative zinc-binding metallopeptidase [Candidatus Symbiobacter mobilis]AGX88024.1 hypothetical protein Cenrod_1948 [Candidatus Symbiobacter mobilis CR]
MKRFHCDCGNEIFFENRFCNVCNNSLGFVPKQQLFINPFTQTGYRFCSNYESLQCNWLIHESDSNPQCIACRLTRIVPNLNKENNWRRWEKLEVTKRRAFYTLLRLHLAIPDRILLPQQPKNGQSQNGQSHNAQSTSQLHSESLSLLFDFLEDQRSNPDSALDFVYTGHANGVVTINVAEADDSYRIATQQCMHEPYRTLLGHFRHELGHYYWSVVVKQDATLHAFRELFGDERADYAKTMQQFYTLGASGDWQNRYISAYASSHPLEDWAETWAHYLHISDTLETACSFGLLPSDEIMGTFHRWLSAWMRFSVTFNALNRSMGMDDPYPFVIGDMVKRKLQFINCLVKGEPLAC